MKIQFPTSLFAGAKKYVSGAVAAAAMLPAVVSAQEVVPSISTNNPSLPDITGIAVGSDGNITGTNQGMNYVYNPSLTTLVSSYLNSTGVGGNSFVTDAGKTADGQGTIELRQNGAFAAYNDSNRQSSFSGNLNLIASSSGFTSAYGAITNSWGVSDERTGPSGNFMLFGVSTSSTNHVLSYDRTNQTLTPLFTFGGTPTGLSSYSFITGSSALADQRALVSFGTNGNTTNNSVRSYTTSGSLVQTLTIDNTAGGGSLEDLSRLSDGTLVMGYSGGGVGYIDAGSANLAVSPIPEPSTYAALAGLGALLFGANRRRVEKGGQPLRKIVARSLDKPVG